MFSQVELELHLSENFNSQELVLFNQSQNLGSNRVLDNNDSMKEIEFVHLLKHRVESVRVNFGLCWKEHSDFLLFVFILFRKLQFFCSKSCKIVDGVFIHLGKFIKSLSKFGLRNDIASVLKHFDHCSG